MQHERIADIALRAGLAFSFLYPAVNAYWNPDSWLGYFPSFVKGFVPDPILLHMFGGVEVILALWLLFGRHIFYPAVIMALMLVGIVVFNPGNFEVVFRDLSIAAIGLALALYHMPKSFTGRTLTV